MPSGGQVRIDLATTAVGRRFVARYSNVRPGDHVLITVTELPAVGEARGVSGRSSPSTDRPGVDVGVLVDLIASCGGHLWLEAQPAGNMVVKIHLPKAPADATDNRGGRLSRWFRSTSAGNVHAYTDAMKPGSGVATTSPKLGKSRDKSSERQKMSETS